MRFVSRRLTLGAVGTAAACLLGSVLAVGQAPQQERVPMAEEAFRNIQVLRGIPVDEFMATMGIFAAATGLNCTECHGGDDRNWESYADDSIPQKQTARRMYVIMTTINQSFFEGRQVVTCYTCHQGVARPRATANLDVQYNPPIPDEPADLTENAFGAPSAEEVLNNYIEALGGAQRLNALTSLAARGTSTGYGPENLPRELELYARGPNQINLVIHTEDGDKITTFDGRNAWTVVPHRPTPMPVLQLSGDDLDGARLEAEVLFPTRLRETLSEWLVGFTYIINDREARFVQARVRPDAPPVKLFFDVETGLLLRMVRYTASPVGRAPTRVDFDDYREVNGVKIPFRWTVTWTNGRETNQLTEVQPNVAVDASRFARPTAAPAAAGAAR